LFAERGVLRRKCNGGSTGHEERPTCQSLVFDDKRFSVGRQKMIEAVTRMLQKKGKNDIFYDEF